MAEKATIFKADLAVADMDRNHFATHALTLARHPSETDERMMVRLLAFALHASDALAFGRGLSSEDEADLTQRDLTGAIHLWIDVGLPDERSLRKASGRAERVVVYAYGGRAVDQWWTKNGDLLQRLPNFSAFGVPLAGSQALARLAQRTMQLQCTVQDGHLWFSNATETVAITLAVLHRQLPV
jgi:uncharacterized protein YaeQ